MTPAQPCLDQQATEYFAPLSNDESILFMTSNQGFDSSEKATSAFQNSDSCGQDMFMDVLATASLNPCYASSVDLDMNMPERGCLEIAESPADCWGKN